MTPPPRSNSISAGRTSGRRGIRPPSYQWRSTGGAEPRLYWTDLDSLHTCPDPRLRTRARDLARLYVSFLSPAAAQHGADGRAFEELVERYLTFSVEPRSQAGEYLRRIHAWSERRLERNILRAMGVSGCNAAALGDVDD